MSLSAPTHRFTVAEYQKLGETGILCEDARVVYRDPQGGAYRTTFRFGRNASVSPLAFPDVEVRVNEILP